MATKISSIKNIKKLQASLGYHFSNDALLIQALTHRSFQAPHNERLEFLGDAVLNLIMAETLYKRFPNEKEGQLSHLRSSLVNQTTLTSMAIQLGLGNYLLLGAGELKTGGAQRASTLEDAVEALIGAIYLDGGIESCRERILHWFDKQLAEMDALKPSKDPKSLLQEWLQSKNGGLPEYLLIKTEGLAHAKTFYVHCRVYGLDAPTLGVGSSRRRAEQLAAEKALTLLSLTYKIKT